MTDRSVDQVNAGTNQQYYTETEYREAAATVMSQLVDLYDDPDVLYYDRNQVAGSILDAIANQAARQIERFSKFLRANLYRQKSHLGQAKRGDEIWDEEMIKLEQQELQLAKSITMHQVTRDAAAKEYMTMTGDTWVSWAERKAAQAADPRAQAAESRLSDLEAKLKALG